MEETVMTATKVASILISWILGIATGCQASASLEPTENSGGSAPSQQELKMVEEKHNPSFVALEQAMKNPKLRGVITRQVHPNASVISLEDLNPASQTSFLNAAPDTSPGFAIADFNGDGVQDYAALLYFPQRKGTGEWLVVFLGSRDGGFQLRLLEKYDGFHDDIY